MRISGLFFEHEGFTTDNPKRALKNMLNRGLAQAERIILDDCGATDAFIIRSIFNHIRLGDEVAEVWIHYNDGMLRQLYKKQ